MKTLLHDLIEFERQFGYIALKSAIYHGAFTTTITRSSADVVFEMCHPSKETIDTVPKRFRDLYINAYT
jgi:hypothetical protein